MTKEQYDQMRFQAACAAMTGLEAKYGSEMYGPSLARWSLLDADALLKELGIDEPKKEPTNSTKICAGMMVPCPKCRNRYCDGCFGECPRCAEPKE